MRATRGAMAALMIAGLGSVAFAGQPVREAARTSGPLMAGYAVVSSAVQEPKEKPEAKPPMAEKQEKPAKASKANKAEKKQAKAQSKADRKRDKKQAKADQKADKNGDGQHGKIKDKDYKAHFGQEHKFSAKRVITTTHIVANQTRFTYVGYTFMFVDPWPMGWGFDDDVYIDYMDGGYYMFDVMHPGVQVGLTIVM